MITTTFKKYILVIFSFMLLLSALWASSAEAALRCEERSRSCLDGSTRAVAVSGGQIFLPPPVIEGYGSACWHWRKQFQCIETNPIYNCESGRSYQTVRDTCKLVSSEILSTEKIRSITYVTSARYKYRCNYGEWLTTDRLPEGKECVLLEQEIRDTGFVRGDNEGSSPYSGNPPVANSLSKNVTVEQEKQDDYVCYSPPVTNCSDQCFENRPNPSTGQMEAVTVPCSSPVTNCVSNTSSCNSVINDAQNAKLSDMALGPDGRCVASTETFLCENGPIPRCLANENCTLQQATRASVQENGVATQQEQVYLCTNTTKSCAEISEASNCVSVAAWGWDRLQHRAEMGVGLADYNKAMAQLDAIEKGQNDNDIYIFSGQALNCKYPVGNFLNTLIIVAMVVATMVMTGGASSGLLSTAINSAASSAFTSGLISGPAFMAITANSVAIGATVSIGSALASDIPNSKAFGSDCCKSHVVEGSDAWYKFGKCTSDEVKLSVARRKGLDYYLGEYCSKRSGFPIRQCVQRTKSYCVFDDMLALVVNKQGRQQLDEIAAADPTTAILTSEQNFSLFAPETGWHKYAGVMNNGSWKQLLNQGGSQVWYWQYPNYCRSPELNKRAHEIYDAEANAAADIKGTQPKNYGFAQASQTVGKISQLVPFQECAEHPGMIYFMTCSSANNDCDTSRLPEGPSGALVDYYGGDVSQADVRWRPQMVRGDYLPGQYGIVNTMQTNPGYAAVSSALSEWVSSVGSCQSGNCLYRFAITDKAKAGGMGARKRITEYAQFPLYTMQESPTFPAIRYLAADGTFDANAWNSDPNKGAGDSIGLSNHAFIFRPNFQTTQPKGDNMHSHVLLEWSPRGENFSPILLPTNLPQGQPGYWPYGNASSSENHFYIQGSCDRNSRWCNYQMEVTLDIPRHPWGTAKSPRCWGFSIAQMAALDFDRMDLSEWLNSLDLSAASAGLSEDAAQAMADQMVATSQASYSAVSKGETIQSPLPGAKALVTNTDTLPLLSSEPFKAYVLQVAVTSNWPQYFPSEPNLNPVTNVKIDWGDGSPMETLALDSAGAAYVGEHDYGDADPKEYRITVTLNTKDNGAQKLGTIVRVTPNPGNPVPKGRELTFDRPGEVGKYPQQVIPAQTVDGTMINPENIEQLSPGTVVQFEKQGDEVANPGILKSNKN